MNSTRGKRIPVTHLDPDADSLRNIHSSVNSETVRIAVVDEDRLFVEGICALLNQWDEFDVGGERAIVPKMPLPFVLGPLLLFYCSECASEER